jgi:hypothetical protein
MTTTHAQQRTDDRAASTLVIDRVTDRLRELIESRTTSEPTWVRAHAGPCPSWPASPRADFAAVVASLTPEHRGVPTCVTCGFALRDGDGQRLVPRQHTMEHPPLLEQLHDAIVGSTAGASSSGGYESRPTLNVEALDAWTAVDQGARFWVQAVTNTRTAADAEVLIADLIGRLPTLDREDLRLVDQDVLRWWGRARVATTWDTPPLRPHVPCMNCDQRGKLRVRVDPLLAVCLACGAAWDESTIGILGAHIRIMAGEPPTEAGPMRQADPGPAGVREGR